jgi:hypothetical protein
LSKIDHVKGKFLKYPVVTVYIGIGKIAQFNLPIAKSEMVALVFVKIRKKYTSNVHEKCTAKIGINY